MSTVLAGIGIRIHFQTREEKSDVQRLVEVLGEIEGAHAGHSVWHIIDLSEALTPLEAERDSLIARLKTAEALAKAFSDGESIGSACHELATYRELHKGE